jgi:hypothetical protein
MIIHIKELSILRTILLGREMIVREYKDIFCENICSNFANFVRIV